MNTLLGRHAIIECNGETSKCSEKELEVLMRRAAELAGATVLGATFHPFGDTEGVTGFLILAESHISVHTWPELSYSAFDIFMCGDVDIDLAIKTLCEFDKSGKYQVKIIDRVAPVK